MHPGGIHITLENFQHVSCEELDKRLLSSDLGVENINIEELIGACQSDGTVQSNRYSVLLRIGLISWGAHTKEHCAFAILSHQFRKLL